MKNAYIKPTLLKGKIKIPASKSISHRAVICAGLAEGTSRIGNLVFSKDIEATCEAMRSFGTNFAREGDSLTITGSAGLNEVYSSFDCNESGSTLRFLIPLAAAAGGESTFTGQGKLVERPLDAFYSIFDQQRLDYKNDHGKLPLLIRGKLQPAVFKVSGDVSSQFITGLLFALPMLEGDSKIMVTTELESKPYIDLTIDMLNRYSVQVENKNNAYREFMIKGRQCYHAIDYDIEGDFSQVAFWLVAGLLGADLWCGGMNLDSLQGDKAVLDIIRQMGGTLIVDGEWIKAMPSSTTGIVIDASQCPDLVPILAVLAAFSSGTTEIINAARLRIKESDRLSAMTTELRKIGANIEEKEDGLVIHGKEQLQGGICDSWNDHRIAMALAVASIRCTEPIVIQNAASVSKSYPDFWTHFTKLGGQVDEWDLGR